MNEWKQHLSGYLKEELADSERYAQLARETNFETRQMFHDMAEEEYEHAHMIWHMMEHLNMTDGMNKDEIFHSAKAALYK